MQRMLVIGPCGAGKSTLSVQLGRRFDLPVHHLDQLSWQTGWAKRNTEEVLEKVGAIVATDRWLIDGNYGDSMAGRLARADTVVYLDYPIWRCTQRLLRRIWTYRGRSRPDMPQGCPERFELEFFLYLLKWNTGPRRLTEVRLQSFTGEIVRMRSPRELARWLKSLPNGGRTTSAI